MPRRSKLSSVRRCLSTFRDRRGRRFRRSTKRAEPLILVTDEESRGSDHARHIAQRPTVCCCASPQAIITVRTQRSTSLRDVRDDLAPQIGKGIVADYIPTLANVDPSKCGISVAMPSGESFSTGDADKAFSIQSISKVLAVTLALGKVGDRLWMRVGRESSGSPFNSIVQLEYENGIPTQSFHQLGRHRSGRHYPRWASSPRGNH